LRQVLLNTKILLIVELNLTQMRQNDYDDKIGCYVIFEAVLRPG